MYGIIKCLVCGENHEADIRNIGAYNIHSIKCLYLLPDYKLEVSFISTDSTTNKLILSDFDFYINDSKPHYSKAKMRSYLKLRWYTNNDYAVYINERMTGVNDVNVLSAQINPTYVVDQFNYIDFIGHCMKVALNQCLA